MPPTPDPTEDEAALVRRSVHGDHEAFAELYRRRARLVVALCYDATGSLDAAADLAQDAFARAYAQLGKLRDPTRFGPWLVTLTRHVIREALRARGRYQRHWREFAGRTASGDDATPHHQRLRNAIALLPEEERLALHAFYLEGRDADTVAALLGMSRAKVYRRLERGRERLRELIEALETIR